MDGSNDLLKSLQNRMARFDDEAWMALASRGLLRRARKDLESGAIPRLLDAPPGLIRVEITPFVVELDEQGPSRARCTCPAPGCCQHILAACLHLAAAGNATEVETGDGVPSVAVESVVNSRPKQGKAPAVKKTDSLLALQNLLEQSVSLGFSHLDSSWVQRLRGIALACRVEGWPRAALETNACAAELERLLERKASSDIDRLFSASARLYALAESLLRQGNDAPPELVGSVRTVYDSQGSLDLLGIGAYPWETDSGYLGITALFWCPLRGQVFSWSESRPRAQRGSFSPLTAYAQAVPWGGGHSLQSLIGHRFTLTGATANPSRRLGGSQTCRIHTPPVPASRADLPPALQRWEAFRNRPRAMGLRRGSPLDGVVRLQPARWGGAVFDEVSQHLLLPFYDPDGDTLHLVLPHTPWTKAAVEQIERATFQNDADSIIGFPTPDGAGIFPVAWLHCDNSIEFRPLFFPPNDPDPTAVQSGHPTWRSTLADYGEQDHALAPTDPLYPFFLQIRESLNRAAQSGTAPTISSTLLNTLEKAGIQRLATALRQPHTPRHLLVLRYLFEA